MFAALLGYNPIQTLLGPALTKLPAHSAAYLTGHSFFPSLISGPFQAGLQIAFDLSNIMVSQIYAAGQGSVTGGFACLTGSQF
jgi:hypothetical protein